MKEFVQKAAMWFLAFFLLACVGVSVTQRFQPGEATAFFIGMALVLLALVLLAGLKAVGLRRAQKKAQRLEAMKPPPPDPVEQARQQLARRYSEMQEKMNIPPDAQLVHMPANFYAPGVLNLMHYCWKTQNELLLFPRWDSIESNLRLLEYLGESIEKYDIILHPVRVPLYALAFYHRVPSRQNEEGYTLVRYGNTLGEDVAILLAEDAYPVLQSMLPEHDLRELSNRQYPNSAQQISDISLKMQQLKELRVQALIDEEEYAAKKAQMLTML